MYSRLTVSRRRYEKGGRWGLAVGARREAEPSSRAGTPRDTTQTRGVGSRSPARDLPMAYLPPFSGKSWWVPVHWASLVTPVT